MSTSENAAQPEGKRPDIAPGAARLRARLVVCRRAYADLVAAAWAALGAVCDGDPDPWAYLLDELPRPPAGHSLVHVWDAHNTAMQDTISATGTPGWGWRA